MMFNLKNKVVLVTGATGLLGSHYARALFDAGARVVISDISLDNCDKLKNKIKKNSPRILTCELDIANENSIKNCLGSILKKFKRIDGLVNNAAYWVPDPNFYSRSLGDRTTSALENLKKAMDVNVIGTMLVVQGVAEIMKKQRSGVIVNIGSHYGIVANNQSIYPGGKGREIGYYCFSKGGVINYTRYLAALLGKYNIRANTLSPGGVLSGQPEEFVKNYSALTPLGRMANPDDMTGPLVFLFSDEARYITGHNLVVDGGFTAI